MGIEDVLTCREIRETNNPRFKPCAIRRLRCEPVLDFVIFDDSAFFNVDQEHLPGL